MSDVSPQVGRRGSRRRTRCIRVSVSLAVVTSCLQGCTASSSGRNAFATVALYPPPPSVARVAYVADIGDLLFASKPQSRLERFLFNRPSGRHDRIEKPFGLAAGDDALYVCDTKRGLVHVFDLASRRHSTLGETGVGKLLKPLAIALDGAGNRYVADVERREVVVFDENGEAVRALRPTADTPFEPVDVVVEGGAVFVLDRALRRIEVLDPLTGASVRALHGSDDTRETSGDSSLGLPSGLAVGTIGCVYVADALNGTIHKFDSDGVPLPAIGHAGDRAGDLARPKHMAFGPDGILYVVDAAFQRVQMFDESGLCLMLFGGSGAGPGSLTMPAGIAVSRSLLPYLADRIPEGFSADYLIFVSDQFGPWGVRIYAFGRGSADTSDRADPRAQRRQENSGRGEGECLGRARMVDTWHQRDQRHGYLYLEFDASTDGIAARPNAAALVRGKGSSMGVDARYAR